MVDKEEAKSILEVFECDDIKYLQDDIQHFKEMGVT